MQVKRTGRLWVFEGPDSVGKTSISSILVKELSKNGGECVGFSFPGKSSGRVGELIYDLHHAPRKFCIPDITPAALQMLHIAAHVDLIQAQILPALESGISVVLDRFWWSTQVYGEVTGIASEFLKSIISAEKVAWSGVEPDAVFLLQREHPLEFKRNAVWEQHAKHYSDLARHEAGSHEVHQIANNGPIAEAVAAILSLVTTT